MSKNTKDLLGILIGCTLGSFISWALIPDRSLLACLFTSFGATAVVYGLTRFINRRRS